MSMHSSSAKWQMADSASQLPLAARCSRACPPHASDCGVLWKLYEGVSDQNSSVLLDIITCGSLCRVKRERCQCLCVYYGIQSFQRLPLHFNILKVFNMHKCHFKPACLASLSFSVCRDTSWSTLFTGYTGGNNCWRCYENESIQVMQGQICLRTPQVQPRFPFLLCPQYNISSSAALEATDCRIMLSKVNKLPCRPEVASYLYRSCYSSHYSSLPTGWQEKYRCMLDMMHFWSKFQ